MYSEDEIREMFQAGIDCGQIVASGAAERLSLEPEQLSALAACQGGGLGLGEICGAVNGAAMVIGLACCGEANDPEAKAAAQSMFASFTQEFLRRHPSIRCSRLLGHKIPEEFEDVIREGTMMTLCPRLVHDAQEILESLLAVES